MATLEFFGVLLAGSLSLVYGIAGVALLHFMATRRSPSDAAAWDDVGGAANTDVE